MSASVDAGRSCSEERCAFRMHETITSVGRPFRRRADQKLPHVVHEYHAMTALLSSIGSEMLLHSGHDIETIVARSIPAARQLICRVSAHEILGRSARPRAGGSRFSPGPAESRKTRGSPQCRGDDYDLRLQVRVPTGGGCFAARRRAWTARQNKRAQDVAAQRLNTRRHPHDPGTISIRSGPRRAGGAA